MENAVDALKIAGSVLLFIIGLSIAILTFSQAREAIDVVLQYSDREFLTVQGNENYYYVADNHSGNRNVGLDTVIPAIYRAYKESYKIVFEFSDNYYLYTDNRGNKVNTLESVTDNSEEFIEGILYHKFKKDESDDFKLKFNIASFPPQGSLYNYLSTGNKTIEERFGIYDLGDIREDAVGESVNREDGLSEISRKANEKIKRVITYKITN